MLLESDSESSCSFVSPVPDDDDDDEDEDEEFSFHDEDQSIDGGDASVVLEHKKTKAARDGFSLRQAASTTDSPGATATPSSAEGNMNASSPWLSTQPQTQATTTEGKTKNSNDNHNRHTGNNNNNNNNNTAQHTREEQERSKQPPFKKRKVSLSPTDSLARQHKIRPVLLDDEGEEKGHVIDLLADDTSLPSSSVPEASMSSTPTKKSHKAKNSILSPSLLAAAKKQQKEHIAATKQKQTQRQKQQQKNNAIENENENQSRKESSSPDAAAAAIRDSKPLSKITEIAYAETSNEKTPKQGSKRKPSPGKDVQTRKATSTASKTKSSPEATGSKKAKTISKESALTKSRNQDKPATAKSTACTKIESKAAATVQSGDAVNPSAKPTKTSAKAAPTNPEPKRKPKAKRTTFEDQLLQKMFLTCRPYSVKDLIQLMGKTTNEASVKFCLLSHIDKGWVIQKTFESKNRTKELYWANQDCKDPKLWARDCLQLPSPDTIRAARMELAGLQQRQKSIERDIAVVEQTPSNAELSVRCNAAEEEVSALRAKLDAVRGRIAAASSGSGSAPPASRKPGIGSGSGLGIRPRSNRGGFRQPQPPKASATPLRLKKRINAMRQEWITRKRKCMDFVDQLADGMEKKVKDVVHKILELETDEAENARLPPKHVL